MGPHECMPCKVAEAQFAHVGEEKGLISLTLALNGDPLDPEVLDRFAFEVKERHARRLAETGDARKPRRPTDVGSLARGLQTKALMKALKVLTPLPGLFGG